MGRKYARQSRPLYGRVKGFSRLTRVENRRQAIYAHSITHSPSYQKSKSMKAVKREHDFLVEHYIENHKSPLPLRGEESDG